MGVTVEGAKAWIQAQLADPDWMDAVNTASANTVYRGQQYRAMTFDWSHDVSVLPMGTCEAARSFILMKRDGVIPKDSVIVIHNFADQKYVGGYFNKRTSSAQEENICSNTGLYGILLQHANQHDMLYTKAKGYPKSYLNKQFVPMLYHHDVPITMVPGITRDFEKVDIVTAAAYNIRNESDKPENYERLVYRQVENLMQLIDAENGNKSVYFITGAWGCGVFRNDPEFMFNTMKSCIEGCPPGHDRLHMVIAVPSGRNLVVANEVFKGMS